MDSATLNRVIWRWHFWAGILISPILIVAASTGAIYIFKAEIERLQYPHLMFSKGDQRLVSLAAQVQAASDYAGEGWQAGAVHINNLQPSLANGVFLRKGRHEFKTVRVDPYDGEVLGSIPDDGFLDIVLQIHRNLFIGTTGRIFVELMTAWTIVLLLTGIWLWWPKRWTKLAGVLIPRLSKNRYTALRDMHSIGGFIIFPVAIIIAITGLLYSLVWGTTFLLAGATSGSFDIEFNPPKSKVPTSELATGKLNVDDIMELALNRKMPMGRITIEMPHDEEAAFAFKSGGQWGPYATSVLIIDQYSGQELEFKNLSQLPWMAQYTQWNYPLHIGSIVGMASKIVWLIVCLALIAMPVTGIWMWFTRSKKGSSGLPKKYTQPLPKWILFFIVILGVLLPMVGISLLAISLWEMIIRHRLPKTIEIANSKE